MKVQNLGSIRQDVKKARQSYVDLFVRSRIEDLAPDVSEGDVDKWKRAARREWEDTSKQTATKAKNRGYAPPAAWDDDTIDDPAAKPAGVRSKPRTRRPSERKAA